MKSFTRALLFLLLVNMCFLEDVESAAAPPSSAVFFFTLGVGVLYESMAATIRLHYKDTRIQFMKNIASPNPEEYSSIGGDTIPNIETDIKTMKAENTAIKAKNTELEAKNTKLEAENNEFRSLFEILTKHVSLPCEKTCGSKGCYGPFQSQCCHGSAVGKGGACVCPAGNVVDTFFVLSRTLFSA